jgi:Family of unknown function (DUF6194)
MAGVTLEEYLDLARRLPDVEVTTADEASGAPEVAWGDSFISYRPSAPLPGDDREFPFATVVTQNYPGFDTASQLDREGVFRLNFGVGRREYERLLGHTPAEYEQHQDEYDPAAIGVLVPHPTYAVQGWVSLVCGGDIPAEPATSLLTFAYERAAERHRRRLDRHDG